jgi:hypothetical protein
MTTDVERIADEILTLPGPVRAFLAHKLIASLDEGSDADRDREWAEVLDRRSREIESGQVGCRPVNEVIAGIRGRLDAIRRPSS